MWAVLWVEVVRGAVTTDTAEWLEGMMEVCGHALRLLRCLLGEVVNIY